MSQISLTFPDGNKREYAKGVTAAEVAQSIADGLLARNEADRSRVIEQGFARAQTFTWQKTATLTLEAMKKFLAK